MSNEFVGLIKKAGKAQRVGEFQCPYVKDFYVKIAYASKFVMNQIRDAAKEVVSNPRTREREERLNDEKLRKEYTRQLILGWRGLTVGTLAKIVPGAISDADQAKEIPFDIETAEAILEVSLEFENWVIDVATSVDNYTSLVEQKQKEAENLG